VGHVEAVGTELEEHGSTLTGEVDATERPTGSTVGVAVDPIG
jgi:hypothetical protein